MLYLTLFAAGALTILLPCILPLIPIVLGVSIAGRNPWRPLLTVLGMVVSFVGFTFLLFVVLNQFVEFADYLRIATYFALYLFGIGFLIHHRIVQLPLAALGGLFFLSKGWIAVPIAALVGVILMFVGARIATSIQQFGSDVQERTRGEFGEAHPITAFLIGLTMGLVWVPCAGPALGFAFALVRDEPGLRAFLALTAYGLGTAVPLVLIGYGGQAALRSVRVLNRYTLRIKQFAGIVLILTSLAVFHGRKAEIIWIDSQKLGEKDEETWKALKACKGIVVPGGFGIRGIEGKIAAAHYARTQKVPYLGLCLGSQIMAIEFARTFLKDPKMTSEEFDEDGKLPKSKYVVHFLPGQNKGRAKGGTLRLGAYTCKLRKGTKAYQAYDEAGQLSEDGTISERHRHRYEFNNTLRKKLEDKGLLFSGEWPETNLMEIVEIQDHPFMVGSQFHPEFKSRPHRPHPLFRGFMKAVTGKR